MPIFDTKCSLQQIILFNVDIEYPVLLDEIKEILIHEIKTEAPQVHKEIQLLSQSDYAINETTENIYEQLNVWGNYLDGKQYFIESFKALNDKKDNKSKHQMDSKKLVEIYIFDHLYPKIFNINENIQARNEQFQLKMQVLQNLVTAELLEIPHIFTVPSVSFHIQNEFRKINSRKSPRGKMQILRCIFDNLIEIYKTGFFVMHPSADDIFPAIIYSILISNPDNLYSNIDYIYKYIDKSTLMGEDGFVLTNISAAISFLENIDGSALIKGKIQINNQKVLLSTVI